MPSPPRKCVFPGCRSLQSSSTVTLFKFPKDDRMRKRWIDFVKSHIDGELRITTNTRLCSDHFTLDSFTNYHQILLGFMDGPLVLVNGAEPTLSLPGLHPPVSPTADTVAGSMCPPKSYLPATREQGCQCDDIQRVIREIGCQMDRFVEKRTVATQLSKTTLSNTKNTGSQATVATRSVAVGNTTSRRLPLCSSAPHKRKAVPPDDPPAKRPVREFPSFQESEASFSFADPDDSTYLPSVSESVDITSEQAPVKPPQDKVKYLVYEECLLELFKICPCCSRVCKVQTFGKGTLLSVTQKCLHQSCLYTREWKSQPPEGSSPAGNLHQSAAVVSRPD